VLDFIFYLLYNIKIDLLSTRGQQMAKRISEEQLTQLEAEVAKHAKMLNDWAVENGLLESEKQIILNYQIKRKEKEIIERPLSDEEWATINKLPLSDFQKIFLSRFKNEEGILLGDLKEARNFGRRQHRYRPRSSMTVLETLFRHAKLPFVFTVSEGGTESEKWFLSAYEY
jgi:hypothetical protein